MTVLGRIKTFFRRPKPEPKAVETAEKKEVSEDTLAEGG